MLTESIKTRVIGVDINVDNTTYAIVDIKGHILAMDSFVSEDYPDIDSYLSVLTNGILELVEANGGYESVRSIGISSPSANLRTGCLENPPNLPWKGVIPLAAMLRDQLGLAVILANDAYAFALGEYAFGPAHGMKNFVLVTTGSGLGSCMFVNGEVHSGYHGFAGELGHTCVVPQGRLCSCGKRGCLESYVVGRGIAKTVQEILSKSDAPSLLRGVEKLRMRDIVEAFKQGDEVAVEAARITAGYLGTGLATYATLANPQAIIITGDLTLWGHSFNAMVDEVFEHHVFPNMRGKVKIIFSHLDAQELHLLGASVMAWDVKEYSLFL